MELTVEKMGAFTAWRREVKPGRDQREFAGAVMRGESRCETWVRREFILRVHLDVC